MYIALAMKCAGIYNNMLSVTHACIVHRTRAITNVVYGKYAENEPVSGVYKMADYRVLVEYGNNKLHVSLQRSHCTKNSKLASLAVLAGQELLLDLYDVMYTSLQFAGVRV